MSVSKERISFRIPCKGNSLRGTCEHRCTFHAVILISRNRVHMFPDFPKVVRTPPPIFRDRGQGYSIHRPTYLATTAPTNPTAFSSAIFHANNPAFRKPREADERNA
ncbi:hypothetical protein Mapa_014042 [Marchantia paleacea]|nr:hypothetical protein Mapa_014042 [Marchantia paleacea]